MRLNIEEYARQKGKVWREIHVERVMSLMMDGTHESRLRAEICAEKMILISVDKEQGPSPA